MKTLIMILAAMTILSFSANAQFNGIKNTVKNGADKVGIGKNNKDKKDKNNNEDSDETVTETDETSIDNSDSNVVEEVVSNTPSMENGVGYFYSTYSSDDYVKEANIGDELYVRMNFGKTMNEFHEEFGLEVSHYSYGWVNIYINDKLVLEHGPLSFSSNYSKVWTFIDLPLLVKPSFIEEIQNDQSAIETNQDVWVFQQLFNESGISHKYSIAAIQNMKDGKNILKIEFGVANKSDEKMGGVISTAEIVIISDEEGRNELYKCGPKYLRPLEEKERGTLTYTKNSAVPGIDELKVNLDLPEAPKYYNMKWCQSMSCDYDHGTICFYVSIDGEPLAVWNSELWDDDYETLKNFSFVILPKTDAGYTEPGATFNDSKLFKERNSIVYALLDMLYGGSLTTGEHEINIKVYSQESVPMDATYEVSPDYFDKLPYIAEKSVKLNVTQAGINSLIASSSAKKLSHAGGEWAAVDSHLLNAGSGVGEDAILLDVACQTEWQVYKNTWGEILYRTCKADVLYKCKFGTRIEEGVPVKEDYMGGGTYGKPYLEDMVGFANGPWLLNSMHYPVPHDKVK